MSTEPMTTSMIDADRSRGARWWPWPLIVLAVAWMVATRVPVVLNAATHLDSDLAVDGLTVADAARGHWRWHFPGTPHIGIAAAVLDAPIMAIWGPTPEALSAGGVVANVGLALAIAWLAWSAFGPRVAAWSLVPLAFSSTGLIWLAGRLNGGHLVAAAWHAGALALLYRTLSKGGIARSAWLGAWCGLGLFHDQMFIMTLVGLVPSAVAAWWSAGRSRRGIACGLAFALGLGLGDIPNVVGDRLDPHDAYREQFDPITVPEVLLEHGRILAFECLPRLVAGRLLPDARSEPTSAALLGKPGSRRNTLDDDGDLLAWATLLLAIGLFGWSLLALACDPSAPPGGVPRRAVRRALGISSLGLVAGFILNRNIFNSDNYRYIIYFLVPWAVGFGLAMERLARRGWGGTLASWAIAAALATLMTVDTARWYRGFGWIDDRGRPVRRPLGDPALDWLEAHPEVAALFGGYWDVYRLEFLTGGRVVGVPFPIYPDRFPERARALPDGRPEVLLVRPAPESEIFLAQALREGAEPLMTRRGLAFYRWPRRD